MSRPVYYEMTPGDWGGGEHCGLVVEPASKARSYLWCGRGVGPESWPDGYGKLPRHPYQFGDAYETPRLLILPRKSGKAPNDCFFLRRPLVHLATFQGDDREDRPRRLRHSAGRDDHARRRAGTRILYLQRHADAGGQKCRRCGKKRRLADRSVSNGIARLSNAVVQRYRVQSAAERHSIFSSSRIRTKRILRFRHEKAPASREVQGRPLFENGQALKSGRLSRGRAAAPGIARLRRFR